MKAILTYHSIDPSGSAISVDEESFRNHVRWLAGSGIRVVALDELPDVPDGTDAVALTFDDAFVNFGEIAWPLLRDHGLPVTLFVPTGHVGGTNAWNDGLDLPIPSLPILDWDALGRLAEAGVALGSHTRRHPDLRTLDGVTLTDELAGAADRIRLETGRWPTAVAYPFGAHDDRVVTAARRLHTLGCTVELRAFGEAEDPLRLPRLDAYYFRRPGCLEAWGSGRFRSHLWIRARARRLRQTLTAVGALR